MSSTPTTATTPSENLAHRVASTGRSTLERFRQWFEGLFLSVDRIDVVTIMTAIIILQHSPYVAKGLANVMVFLALLIPGVRRNGVFWVAVACIRFISQVPDHWPSLDNHQYLITWWCIGLGLALLCSEAEEVVSRTARLLIGLCFLFATVWKLRSADFLNGDFLSWTMTTDGRLKSFATTFLGLPDNVRELNAESRVLLRLGDVGSTEVFTTGPRVRPMAIAAAWYTVVIESSVAVLYLIPARFRISRFAPIPLLLFILTVYPIAPVVGFALTLVTLSVASATASKKWLFVALPLFAVLPLVEYASDAFDAIG